MNFQFSKKKNTVTSKTMAVFMVALLAATEAGGQATCRGDLTYKWKQGGNGGEVQEVVWASYRYEAVDEPAAKARLEAKYVEEKPKAREACRKEHENLSGCIAIKFSTMASTMQTLSFTARKALEESIAADCKRQQGTCIDPKGTDPQCVAQTSAEEAGENGKEGKGKEAGKKKK